MPKHSLIASNVPLAHTFQQVSLIRRVGPQPKWPRTLPDLATTESGCRLSLIRVRFTNICHHSERPQATASEAAISTGINSDERNVERRLIALLSLEWTPLGSQQHATAGCSTKVPPSRPQCSPVLERSLKVTLSIGRVYCRCGRKIPNDCDSAYSVGMACFLWSVCVADSRHGTVSFFRPILCTTFCRKSRNTLRRARSASEALWFLGNGKERLVRLAGFLGDSGRFWGVLEAQNQLHGSHAFRDPEITLGRFPQR
jgi:hypothetical protein